MLFETGRLARGAPARFHTRWKGELVGTVVGDSIELDFPAAESVIVETPPGLATALGAEPLKAGVNDLHHVAELADAATVRALAPDFAALATVDGVSAVVVTAAGDAPDVDFVSRYFRRGTASTRTRSPERAHEPGTVVGGSARALRGRRSSGEQTHGHRPRAGR